MKEETNIIFENSKIIVAEKPCGILSQEGKGKTMFSLLGRTELYPVHRLDKEASGVIVYGLDSKSAADLSSQITKGVFKKVYFAVVKGRPLEDNGSYEDLLYHDQQANKSYVVKRERKGVRKAILEYKCISSKTIGDDLFTLVKINLVTGRTHQIRVQFASRGMSLWGDRKYGSTILGDMALFSKQITFMLPDSNKITTFSLPLPNTPPFDMWKDEID